ncbi:MAG: hypothetical protein WEA56_03450 [Balneolaceae bacterium]
MRFRVTLSFFLLLLLSGAAFPVTAQIQLGGLADFELKKGQNDSSPYVNQTPNDKWTIYTPYIRIFASADISENWFISSVLQSDYYSGTELSSPFFSVINLNWIPIDDSDFTITAGRFVTPYGVYSNRVLSIDNPFVHLPLTHVFGLPVSQQSGILPYNAEYEEGITGLTMVNQRMYSQGILIQNSLGDSDWLQYKLAAALAPASAYFGTAMYNYPSFTGRIVIQPKIWAQLGLSFSNGPFMHPDDAANRFPDSSLSEFRQILLGSDLLISYRYYSFLIEYNRSLWKAPYINGTETTDYEISEAPVDHISGEAVVRFPFFVGSYAAIRYENLISGSLSSGIYSSGSAWTYDRSRVELLAGYKLHRNIKMKISYLLGTDTGPDLNDNVFAVQLSVAY